jgi:hypothetical protein
MPSRYRHATVRPRDGGQLITRASNADAGLGNYVTKRDWRRDLNDEVRREGYDYFAPDSGGAVAQYLLAEDGQIGLMTEDGQVVAMEPSGTPIQTEGLDVAVDIGNQPFPLTANPSDVGPINLIVRARRQNGLRTIVVGTQTSLYRFVGGDGMGVCEAGVCEDGVLASSSAEWVLAGTGYWAPAGWQVENINGWLVLNNGRDLPMTFRVEDSGVRPIYELREMGVSRVGGISNVSGVLMCHDIHEIPDESLSELFERRGIRLSGSIMARVSSGDPSTVTATSEIFSSTDVGRTIEFADGTEVVIESVSDGYTAAASAVTEDMDPQAFRIKTPASQAGSEHSGSVLMTVAVGGLSVTSSSSYFTLAHVGKWIRFYNGWSALIADIVSDTEVALASDNPSPDSVTSPVHFLTTTTSAPSSPEYIVTADADVFEEDMVGAMLSWDSGNPRLILEYISPTQVRVDSDLAQSSDDIGVENLDTYARYTGTENRKAYRVIWGLQDAPRRWSATMVGGIEAGSGVLILEQPVKSFEAGMQVAVAGAGPSGSNLIAEVLYVEADRFIGIGSPAEVTVEDALVQAADTIGSIVGYEDLEADGTPIRGAAALKEVWVAYKDSAVFLGRYTGSVDRPFEFSRREITESAGLFHPRTLVNVDGQFHVYAARDGFYRFDLSTQAPVLLESAEYCKDLFFDYAHRDPSSVFAAYNPTTREAMFWSGSDTDDRALCLDYVTGTWSTTSIHATAAGAVSRPDMEDDHTWFLLAVGSAIVVYGKSDKPTWGNLSSIFYRRAANPYSDTAYDYTSVLQTGMGDFGNLHAEKDLRAIVPTISSRSPGVGIDLSLLGGRNPGEEMTLAEVSFDCRRKNLVPVHFRQYYFGMGVRVSHALDVKLSSITYDVSGAESASHLRGGE